MIPDHLINKAARAIHVNDPGGGETEEYEDTPPWYQVVTERRARAALEAVAADIWDEGHRTRVQRGPDGCTCNAWNEDECGCGEYGTGPIITPNPYKASEDA